MLGGEKGDCPVRVIGVIYACCARCDLTYGFSLSEFVVVWSTRILLTGLASAQVRGVPAGPSSHAVVTDRHHQRSRLVGNGRRQANAALLYPFWDYDYPFVNSEYDDSDIQSSGAEVSSPEQEQGPKTQAPKVQPVESVVIENRGGEWVRIPASSQLSFAPQYAGGASTAAPLAVATHSRDSAAPVKLPTTVLVFRDGHQEDVTRYVIQGAVLYANADYLTSDSWTREIAISELDVSATKKLNASRGGVFMVPSKPYEVIVRF